MTLYNLIKEHFCDKESVYKKRLTVKDQIFYKKLTGVFNMYQRNAIFPHVHSYQGIKFRKRGLHHQI